MVSNMVLNVILVFPLAHAGLALATSLSAYLNAGLLYRRLRKDQVYHPRSGWRGFWLRVIAANLLMAVLLIILTPSASEWASWGLVERSSQLTVIISAALLTYAAVLFALGMRPRQFLLR